MPALGAVSRKAYWQQEMRNIFDQYEQPENRLTHALVCCLAEDKKLLRHFLRWALKCQLPGREQLEILEQQLPGEPSVSEKETRNPSLPDAWIHSGETWALVIESKVADSVDRCQVSKHMAMAQRRGFAGIHALVLSVKDPPELPDGARHLYWHEVYTWFRRQRQRSAWAARLTDYMEIAEGRMVADDYLKEGKLTCFTGIPFGEENPYNYREAKRVLRLAMEELRRRKDADEQLNVDVKAPGRKAITGRDGWYVWDFLRLKHGADEDDITGVVHPTLSIRTEDTFALVALPSAMKTRYRKNVLSLGKQGFRDIIAEVEGRLVGTLKGFNGAIPWMEVVQRRYPRGRSIPVVDARIEFDLRTAFERAKRGNKATPKHQREWLDTAFSAFENKRSNLQIAIGALFPYKSCPALNTPRAIDAFAAAWIACGPLIDVVLQGHERG